MQALSKYNVQYLINNSFFKLILILFINNINYFFKNQYNIKQLHHEFFWFSIKWFFGTNHSLTKGINIIEVQVSHIAYPDGTVKLGKNMLWCPMSITGYWDFLRTEDAYIVTEPSKCKQITKHWNIVHL